MWEGISALMPPPPPPPHHQCTNPAVAPSCGAATAGLSCVGGNIKGRGKGCEFWKGARASEAHQRVQLALVHAQLRQHVPHVLCATSAPRQRRVSMCTAPSVPRRPTRAGAPGLRDTLVTSAHDAGPLTQMPRSRGCSGGGVLSPGSGRIRVQNTGLILGGSCKHMLLVVHISVHRRLGTYRACLSCDLTP